MLANDFFSVAHDSISMRSRLSDRVLAHTVIDHFRAEPDIRSVSDWLRFLGRDAYEKPARAEWDSCGGAEFMRLSECGSPSEIRCGSAAQVLDDVFVLLPPDDGLRLMTASPRLHRTSVLAAADRSELPDVP